MRLLRANCQPISSATNQTYTPTADDVGNTLRVPEREGSEVEVRVTLGRFGPVDDAGDLVIGNEDVINLKVTVISPLFSFQRTSRG